MLNIKKQNPVANFRVPSSQSSIVSHCPSFIRFTRQRFSNRCILLNSTDIQCLYSILDIRGVLVLYKIESVVGYSIFLHSRYQLEISRQMRVGSSGSRDRLSAHLPTAK